MGHEVRPARDLFIAVTLLYRVANFTILSNDNAAGVFHIFAINPVHKEAESRLRVSERAQLAVELVVERLGGAIGQAFVNWQVNRSASTASQNLDFRADGAILSFAPSETRHSKCQAVPVTHVQVICIG